jgi:DsbC/DsbD-like thiol-disulfide interchange protein
MRHRPLLTTVVMAAGLWCATTAPASDDFGEGRARARLVAGAHVSGTASMLGVTFEIEPGWHIYWRNPGGAGLATEVVWRLPRGLEAGPLRWPLPVSFTQSEGIPGYGYEGSVVLASELRSAPDLDLASAVVGADVSWLACKERCVLGSATLQAPLDEVPVDPGFAQWESRLPRPLEDGDAPFSVTTTGGLAEGSLSLWLHWQDVEPLATTWFPDPPEGLEVGEPTVRTRGGLTRIDAQLRLRSGAAAPDELRSLIVIEGAGDDRRGWNLLTEIEP